MTARCLCNGRGAHDVCDLSSAKLRSTDFKIKRGEWDHRHPPTPPLALDPRDLLLRLQLFQSARSSYPEIRSPEQCKSRLLVTRPFLSTPVA